MHLELKIYELYQEDYLSGFYDSFKDQIIVPKHVILRIF